MRQRYERIIWVIAWFGIFVMDLRSWFDVEGPEIVDIAMKVRR
jgi:hypothetical protein